MNRSHWQRFGQEPDLFLGLDHALREEGLRHRGDRVAALAQRIRVRHAEIGGHGQLGDVAGLQHIIHHIHHGGLGHTALLHPVGDLAEGEDLVHARLRLGPVHLQVAHDQDAVSIGLDEDKRVRRQKLGGVIQVGVLLAVGDYEACGTHRLGT